MAMNTKTWVPLCAAIVLGTVAAKIGRDMLNRQPAEKRVEVRVAKVVIAKENVAGGSPLKATDLAVAQVDEKLAPVGALSSPNELVGRVVTGQLSKGQPVLEAMLAPKGSAVGLTAIVPDGMRAVTLEINEVSGVAGLLSVGCRVDVVSTFPGDNGQMFSKTIVKNLQVIAVGKKFAASGGVAAQQQAKAAEQGEVADNAPIARNVTLLVTPKEAEVIDLAAHTGSPRLVLRGSRDSKPAGEADTSEGISLSELRGGKKDKDAGEPSAWTRAVSSIGTAVERMQQQTQQQPPPVSIFTDSTSPKATTQPAKPTRQVTVIRNTKEENVQLEAPAKTLRGPVMADTKDSADPK